MTNAIDIIKNSIQEAEEIVGATVDAQPIAVRQKAVELLGKAINDPDLHESKDRHSKNFLQDCKTARAILSERIKNEIAALELEDPEVESVMLIVERSIQGSAAIPAAMLTNLLGVAIAEHIDAHASDYEAIGHAACKAANVMFGTRRYVELSPRSLAGAMVDAISLWDHDYAMGRIKAA